MAIADAHGLPLAAHTKAASPAEVKLVQATLGARVIGFLLVLGAKALLLFSGRVFEKIVPTFSPE